MTGMTEDSKLSDAEVIQLWRGQQAEYIRAKSQFDQQCFCVIATLRYQDGRLAYRVAPYCPQYTLGRGPMVRVRTGWYTEAVSSRAAAEMLADRLYACGKDKFEDDAAAIEIVDAKRSRHKRGGRDSPWRSPVIERELYLDKERNELCRPERPKDFPPGTYAREMVRLDKERKAGCRGEI